MKTQISALMDGELESHEVGAAFEALRRDSSLRDDWRDFHRVGEVLRSESDFNADISARVMAMLDSEPTVFVPAVARLADVSAGHAPRMRHPAMALAASLAGVAIVGWVGFGDLGGADVMVQTPFARPVSLAQINHVAAPSPTDSTKSLQAYVVAHQAHASANAFAGHTHYVRTVSRVNLNLSESR